MTELNLVTANMANLADLWKTIGATCHMVHNTPVYKSDQWPHRIWVDIGSPFDPAIIDEILTAMEPFHDSALFPVWREPDDELVAVFGKHDLVPSFQQMNMVMDFQAVDVGQLEQSTELDFHYVSTPEEAAIWAQIGGEAFGYTIDPESIQGLVNNPATVIILAYKDDTPVATTMAYDDGVVVGYHTVGVPARFRRQGIAKQIMSHALLVGQKMGRPYGTLQASKMGAPLYAQLGFERQQVLTSFRKS